jgi:CsoR family transcriptional regulator, copper-sensing transcriptional repressor
LKDKENILKRLNRIEGQVRGINRMIAAGEGCEKVLLQISAVKAALDKAGVLYVQDHLADHLEKSGEVSPESARQLQCLFSVISKFS